ncbi:hypothetical protein D3C85_1892320 [compost metagenome]
MAQYFSILGGTLNNIAKPTAGMADQNASLANSKSSSIMAASLPPRRPGKAPA